MNKKIRSLLKELEQTREKFWNINPETGAFLNLLIKNRNYKTVLEIGTSNGYSGIWLAEALQHTGGKLHTIESNIKKRYPLAEKNFKKSGLTKYIHQILGHAPEAIPKTPKFFDLAFFDATKYEHIEYFNTLKKRIKPGGMIITDNIHSHPKELATYIKTLQKTPHWHSVELHLGTGLLLSLHKP